MKKIICPTVLDCSWLQNFSIDDLNGHNLVEVNNDISLYIDMSNVTFCQPSGLCGLHEIIRRQQGKVSVHRPKEKNTFQYLQRIGFFDNLQIFGNKSFVSHPASGRFKEMTTISKDILPRSSVVESLCREIACVVAPTDRVFQDFILFCTSEMINNLIQHSHSAGITCAQYFNSNNEVEVAIADHGRGIKAGLKDNPFFNSLDSDLEALEIATRQDTSGTFDSPSDPYQIKVNSGNGLYYMKKIIEKCYGYLHIFSHSGYYFQNGTYLPSIQASSFFPGTLVVFRLNRNYTYALQDVLREIREESIDPQLMTDNLSDIQFE